MTIVCTGWKRLTPYSSIHAPTCDLPSTSHDLDETHSMSRACEAAFRTANGLPVKKYEEKEA